MGKEEILSAELEDAQARLWAGVRALVLPGLREEAMDVLQNTNAAILSHAGSWDSGRPSWPWFRAIAFNEALLGGNPVRSVAEKVANSGHCGGGAAPGKSLPGGT